MRAVLPIGAIAVSLGLAACGALAPRSQAAPARAPKAAAVSRVHPRQTAVLSYRPAAASPAAASPAVTGPAASAANLHLAFSAQFPGTALDTRVWATCFPWASAAVGCTTFGGNETEWYVASQDRVSVGALHLVAQPLPTAGLDSRGSPKEYYCRSGMVTTYPSFRFEYGHIRVVGRLAAGTGLWPAFWLAAANQQWPPEMDLVEHFGLVSGLTAVFFHPVGAPQIGHRIYNTSLYQGWHTFDLDWTPTRLSWFVDGKLIMTTTSHIPHQRMYFIANLAYFLKNTASCRGTLLVRSVQVWQT